MLSPCILVLPLAFMPSHPSEGRGLLCPKTQQKVIVSSQITIWSPSHVSASASAKLGAAISPRVPGKGEITRFSCRLHLDWLKDAMKMQPNLSAGMPQVIWMNMADMLKEA